MPEPVTLLALGGGITGLAAHLARRYFELAKEVVDIVLGAIALLLAAPLLLLCGALIMLSDGHPVIFTQIRLGKNGRPFRMYKLRTMYKNAEAQSGAVWASKTDPRVIRLCRWMRRSHVDELPQIINVVRGDMSLVGPRPERPEIFAELEKAYPEVGRRLLVRPGITGLAQVRNGYDTSVEAFRNKLEADLEYISKQNWSTEIRIMAATLGKFNDKGAH